jgi:hypothetical protein
MRMFPDLSTGDWVKMRQAIPPIMIRLIPVVAVVWALVSAAVAEDAVMRGEGTSACQDFVRDYRYEPAFARATFGKWAEGYMSGLNQALAFKHQAVRNIPMDSLVYIRLICDQHPRVPFFEAVFTYFQSLPQLK